MLMDRLEFDLLFLKFVGFGVDDAAWDHSTFSKNRDRLLECDIAARLLSAVLAKPRIKRLLSTDHFSVDGTLIEAWASMKKLQTEAGDGRTACANGEPQRPFGQRLSHPGQRPCGADRGGYAVSQRIRKRIEEAFG
jgi:hypothetical protein